MLHQEKILQTTNPFKSIGNDIVNSRTIFYGEVVSIEDKTDGGRIKVKILDLDNGILNDDLSWCYPMLPKFFHIYPQVGEVVRIFIEDMKYPQRGRFWLGSIISQPHKIGYDNYYGALSTVDYIALVNPEKAPSTYPDSKGVFPEKNDVALVGKVNSDIILKVNEAHIRAGKHDSDDVLKLNTKNPAQISLVYEQEKATDNYYSSTVVMSDKIALISHSGNPKFKSAKLTSEDRKRIFDEGHPIARADVLVQALDIMRKALINHIHGNANISPDKNDVINALEKINFDSILQKNIVTN